MVKKLIEYPDTKRHVAKTLVRDYDDIEHGIHCRIDEDVERVEAPAMWEQMCFKPDRIK